MTIKTFKVAEFNTLSVLSEMGAQNVRYLENGKPVADNCYVSVSHSGDTAVVCKSDRPIGIDIEKIDTPREFQRLAERYFSSAELQYFNDEPTAQRFYEIWTKKEAYSKISGEGIKMIARGFDTFSLKDVTFKTEKRENYIITVCEV